MEGGIMGQTGGWWDLNQKRRKEEEIRMARMKNKDT